MKKRVISAQPMLHAMAYRNGQNLSFECTGWYNLWMRQVARNLTDPEETFLQGK
jgi:hypothetical protein